MAQTLFFPAHLMSTNIPSSPDPTPLRLIAFSVAEAALQSDPNSPSFAIDPTTQPLVGDWMGSWSYAPPLKRADPLEVKRSSSGRRLWDVVAHAKERRDRSYGSPASTNGTLPPSPPISPAEHNFTIPSNSPLAASIEFPPPSRPAIDTLSRLSFTGPTNTKNLPLFTRSAEPSPTKSTFSGLDQSRPPPVFVPRQDITVRSSVDSKVPADSSSTKATSPTVPFPPSRHTSRLPSLAQIQAKMSKSGHRRGRSVESMEISAIPFMPRIKTVQRTISNDSVEVLQTPTDEVPPSRPRILLAGILDRRPPTPPSPGKETRLAPFLRQRTSGRLAEAKARPVSMPPLKGFNVLSIPGSGPDGPVFTITPPTLESQRPPSPFRSSSPKELLNTPPRRSIPTINTTIVSPSSPTNSSTTASPTLSVPIITCTDSDEEEGDVVLFEGETEAEERERKGKEMLNRLMLRRRSG